MRGEITALLSPAILIIASIRLPDSCNFESHSTEQRRLYRLLTWPDMVRVALPSCLKT